MPLSRRIFNTGLGSVFGAIVLFGRAFGGLSLSTRLVSAGRVGDAYHILYVMVMADSKFRVTIGPKLPGRAHGAAIYRSAAGGWIVTVARRPGRYLHITSIDSDGTPTSEGIFLSHGADHHFNGHAVFDPSGRFLYTTETRFNADTGQQSGIIGVYEVPSLRRVASWPTLGIDPHELVLHQNGQMITVLNGGREMDPDFPRLQLNAGSISSSITSVDSGSGTVIQHSAGDMVAKNVSIRHLTVLDETVWWGGQLEENMPTGTPLIGSYTLESGIDPNPVGGLARLGRYIGSIARVSDSDAAHVVVTNPRHDRAAIIDTTRRWVDSTVNIEDVCGVAPSPLGVILSDGTGGIGTLSNRDRLANIQWDNHLTAV